MVAHAAALLRDLGARGSERGADAGLRPERADIVGGRIARVRVRPVAGDLTVNETGEACAQRFVAEAKLFQDARTHVGDEDIGICNQAEGDISRLLEIEVEGHAALAPVVELKRWIERRRVAEHGGEEAAERVAGWWLYLDDLRAPVSEDRGG